MSETYLVRRRRSHAVARRRSRRQRRDGARGRRPLQPDADVHAGLEARARRPDCRIPRVEVGQGDALDGGDVGAAVAAAHEVERVAVADHARLHRRRRGDAVARRGCGCREHGDGLRGRGALEADAYVHAGLQPGARRPDGGVPGVEIGQGDSYC